MGEPGAAPARRMDMVPERAKLHTAMTIFQFGYAGNHVIMRTALNMGVSKLIFPLYRNIIALFVLVPFAYLLEKYVISPPIYCKKSIVWILTSTQFLFFFDLICRKDRPALTPSFLVQFFFLGLVGYFLIIKSSLN